MAPGGGEELRARVVTGHLGTVLKFFSFAYLVPVVPAFVFEPRTYILAGISMPKNAAYFAALFLATLVLGFLVERIGSREEMRDDEGYAIVGLAWFLMAAAAAIPFYVTHAIRDPADLFFEAMSGVTTTGFTVLANPETLPASLLFWRSFIQFIGGGGIIVLMVAVLSKLTGGAVRLMRAEVAGGSVTRIKPKIAQTAKLLWTVYAGITLVLAAILAVVLRYRHEYSWREGVFEGILYAFTTVSTAGFAPTAASAGVFDDWVFETVILVGMLLGGVSFTLLFFALQGRPRDLVRDPEFRVFAGVYVVFTLLLTAILLHGSVASFEANEEAWLSMGLAGGEQDSESALKALRYAAFQAGTFITSTGYNTVDYDLWPDSARLLLVLLTFVGGMYGSTAGGPKAFRMLLLGRIVWREVLRLVHPRAHVSVKIRGKAVTDDIVRGVVAFFFAYLVLFVGSVVVIALHGYDFVSSITVAAGTIGNTGTAMGIGGPAGGGFADVASSLKVYLGFIMWFGRLEIFAALVLFFPATYRR